MENPENSRPTALVAGASGATGRWLVRRLLDRGWDVRAVVRSPGSLPEDLRGRDRLEIVTAAILDLSDDELAQRVRGCQAVASCLGHTMSFRGMYGPPRMLVTEATRRLCAAIRANAPKSPVRFVLMNTAGNRNRDLSERVSPGERVVIGLIRALVPPHLDNERAADFLRTGVGSDDRQIEWAAVRPDGLIDADAVSPYEVHASPTRSAIFNAGTTSRINVADFMATLMTEDEIWARWKGQMPVIYNREGG